MADPCAPLAPCNDLDGKLLMQRSVYGPQLAFDPGTVSLAGLSTRGAALRGVLDLLFEVRWRSTGLRQGPATSVMGLAPGEVVTVGLRTRSTRTFSSLIRDAAESSRSSSHSERDTGPAPKPPSGAVGGAVGSVVGGVVGTVTNIGTAAGNAISDLVDNVVGGAAGAGAAAGLVG